MNNRSQVIQLLPPVVSHSFEAFLNEWPQIRQQWRRDDCVFIRNNVFENDMLGTVWDNNNYDTVVETLRTSYHAQLRIPLQVTNRYLNAFEYFADAIKFAVEHGLRVYMEVAPSDHGLPAIVGDVDYRAEWYGVEFKNSYALSSFVSLHFDWIYVRLNPAVDYEVDVTAPSWSVVLRPLTDRLLTVPYVAVACTFWRKLMVEERRILSLGTNLLYRWRQGELTNNWLFDNTVIYAEQPADYRDVNDDGIETRPTVHTYVYDCPLDILDEFNKAYKDLQLDNIQRRPPRVFHLCDRIPPLNVSSIETRWILSAAVRQPFLTHTIIDIVLCFHFLPRYVVLEVLEWLSNIKRLVTRLRLDQLTASVYATIRRLQRFKDGPSRSTRARHLLEMSNKH